MEEKSGLDKLIENLAELGLYPDVYVENKGAFFPRHNRFASSTTVTVLLSDATYFLARSNVSSSFTGIYSSIELPVEAEYKVHKRDWFDFLFFSKKQKVGIKYIDKNLTIASPKWIPSKELNLENANLFLEINKAGKPYKLVVENNYLFSIIEPLIDKKIIGVETNDWLYEKEDLENLLKIGGELIRKIKKNTNKNFEI
ncbi:MAG: hypothetical protein FWH23_03010 [Bacteroidales bacterium]|nr:hypothetical protein [Bacteroidales bacterium]